MAARLTSSSVTQPGSDHTRRASLSPSRKAPRLAAGRARALGLPTRGTTNANRLRRVDRWLLATQVPRDRKSTRLNSSHANISYAVFCLKKKKNMKLEVY